MNTFSLRDKLRAGTFVVTVELEPPKGADPDPTLTKAKKLYGTVDAVNIADSPMATMRMSPIALSHILQKDVNMEAIFHLTCRDRNLLGLQSELLGAAALGVRNILTLTGDSPKQGDHPDASGIFDVNSVGLAKIAKTLNEGKDLSGKDLNKPSDFFIGAVANPGADDLDDEIRKVKEKIAAGVEFFQTQPVFDIETVLTFEKRLAEENITAKILYGILPLKSFKVATYLNDKVPGIRISREIMDRVEAGGQVAGVAIAKELYHELRKLSIAGVHIFPIGDLNMVHTILDIE
ncbi:5,10-methylenetetrahydrofolate reductase [Desulfuribacillus stibiiarsenatis]|uniref:Methylenetetrahydrofolate reductase n=1 Tax=Desulfuribacillus stibiiarsenatis TaxID=1390249 RepID=A0A1E5LAB9_9FIRM|nr:methylenetetrahydrofolate reductase [Desulfuribacillus stibiiarsenatis]OEH87014.1 5,10-methylenetetrahydrofolate reductase [Desulfuribacillus stibiiarsenatis]